MTETTTAATPPSDTAEETSEAATDPTDILMYVIVSLLAPIFLCGCDSMYFARLAAWKTVAHYRPRNHVHLIAIAQIIASGLAGVGSIGLAFSEDVSMSMSLRLRANAAALFRAAEQARRVLREGSPPVRKVSENEPHPEPEFIPDPNQEEFETALIAAIADTQKRAAETLARIDPGYTPPPTACTIADPAQAVPSETAKPAASTPAKTTAANSTATAPVKTTAATTTATAPANTAKTMSDAVWQGRWASAMTDVAREFTESLKDLSPAERAAAIQRADALNTVATTLLSGNGPPALKPSRPT